MKICIDAREFVQGRKTGISRYLETFLPALQQQHELVLFVNELSAVPEDILNGQTRRITLPGSSILFTDQVVIPRLTSKEKADVFFSPYYKVPLSGRFKRIITVHDIMFLRLHDENPVNRLLSGLQLRLSTARADLILADSDFTKRDLLDFIPGIERKISVLRPTLSPGWASCADGQTDVAVRAKHTAGRPYFLYVGNFKPHKNVDLLVRTFLKLETDKCLGNHCLVLAGGDPVNNSRIKILAGKAIDRGLIKILADIPEKELRPLYSSAEWFITASSYEGFGYPALEAMTCACPVICMPCTSLPEIVGNTALFLPEPTETALSKVVRKTLLIPESDRKQLAEKSLAVARKFIEVNPPERLLTLIKDIQ